MSKKYRINLVPGDGIGKEVIPEGVKVLDALAAQHGFGLDYQEFPYSCEYRARHGRMMPEDGIEQLSQCDAIYLGAVGYPGVPDHVSLWELLIPIRREFQQYVSVRPVRLLPGIRSPLADRTAEEINFIVVRENNEGEYSEIGGRIYSGTEMESANQLSVFSRRGVDRILRYAFELARTRPRRHVTSATKSNGIVHTLPFWDERFAIMKKEYPDIKTDQFHIDILCAHFVQHPDWFDVAGSIGIAPSSNLNPERTFPSMFEPVHGSAPDIEGKGVANPIAAFWSGVLMLEHLGEGEAGKRLMGAIEKVTGAGKTLTPDLRGKASTGEVTDAVIAALGT
jgi:tartrate dehydrogenase/decarboxylase/D-malate dehydrogenase